jgi:hypothetical protein
MSIRLTMVKHPDHLVAKFTGDGGLDEVSAQFGSIADHCRKAKLRRLLIDIRAIKRVPSVSARYQAGERAVVFLEFGIKVAVLGPSELLDPGRLGELVAQNRGVDAHVFSGLAAAKKWLLK